MCGAMSSRTRCNPGAVAAILAPSLQYVLLATTAWLYYCLSSCFTTATALLAVLLLLFSRSRSNQCSFPPIYAPYYTHTHTHTTHTLRLLVAALLFVCCNTTVFAPSRNTCSCRVSLHALTRLRRRYCVLQSHTRGAPAISLSTRNLSVRCSLTQIHTHTQEKKT